MTNPTRVPNRGDLIAGKYRLENVIGHGGFATVFEAVDVTLDRNVAVKVLNPGEGYEHALARRFKREAQLVSSLSDPHTIRMFDFGQTEQGVLYMVFELLSGEDLSTRLQRDGAMPQSDVERVVRQVLESLREAHGYGLLHRDIKPANIRVFPYIDDPLRVKLMDFGIARDAGGDGRVTKTGSIVGTPRYMSPEQFTGEELTPASDLFSLGLVTLEMLTGEPAPRQDIILGKPPPTPATGRLGALLSLMLPAEADDRVQTVGDALAILSGAEDVDATTKLTVRREPLPAAEPVNEPVRTGVMVTALLATAALVGLVVVLWNSSSADEQVVEPAPVELHAEVLQAAATPERTPNEELKDAGMAVDLAVGDVDVAPSGCGRPDFPRREGRTIELVASVGLAEHIYDVVLPETYTADRPYGVLIAFHDAGASRAKLRRSIHAKKASEAHDVIIAAPAGNSVIPWESEGVNGLAREMLRQLRSQYCVDPDRVYVLGNGRGGVAAERMTCEPWVTAVATMGYRMWREQNMCDMPASYLHLAPLRSGHLPLEGGMDCLWESTVIALRDHDRLWRERNRCDEDSQKATKLEAGTCFTWDCDAPYESCHIKGGKPWPGFDARDLDVLRCDGEAAKFPIHQRMWGFFDRVTAWKRER